jgi:hypothetical protein
MWLSLQDQKANVVIIAGPGSQRGHHCRTRKPTWSSLQDQKANVVITTGLESQRGNHCRTRKPTWSSLQDHKANVVITAQSLPRWLSGPAVMSTLAFYSCSDDHVGFLVL